MSANQIKEMISKLGTKERAIQELCKVSNFNCLAVYELWCYKELAAHFGITRGDYYNHYEELTEEDRMHIGDNWKPNIGTKEERLARLENDLDRACGQFKYTERDLMGGKFRQPQKYTALCFYECHAAMFAELLKDMRELVGKPKGAMSVSDIVDTETEGNK